MKFRFFSIGYKNTFLDVHRHVTENRIQNLPTGISVPFLHDARCRLIFSLLEYINFVSLEHKHINKQFWMASDDDLSRLYYACD